MRIAILDDRARVRAVMRSRSAEVAVSIDPGSELLVEIEWSSR